MRTITIAILFASLGAIAADRSISPFKLEDIRIVLGAYQPCLKLIPQRVEFNAGAEMITVHMKQVLKKDISACSTGIGSPGALIHDSIGNELWSGHLSLPSEVGHANLNPILILWIPSDLKPPITLKMKK